MDHLSLEKQEIRALAGEVSNMSNTRLTIKEVKDQLTKIEKKAKKEGYKDLDVRFDYNAGYEGSDGEAFISVNGTRLETDHEWHQRLEHNRSRDQHELRAFDNAEKMMKIYNDAITKIDEALSKSPLKCVKCGKPTSSKQLDSRNKWRIICCDCHTN